MEAVHAVVPLETWPELTGPLLGSQETNLAEMDTPPPKRIKYKNLKKAILTRVEAHEMIANRRGKGIKWI